MTETQQVGQTLAVFQRGFLICLVLAVSFFIVTVVLFFAFDISKILKLKLGMEQKKTVQQMSERNLERGKKSRKLYSVGFTKEKMHDKSENTGKNGIKEPVLPTQLDTVDLANMGVLAPCGEETVALPQNQIQPFVVPSAPTEETVVLAQSQVPLVAKAAPYSEETVVLSPNRKTQKSSGKDDFIIMKETLLTPSTEDAETFE